jgi:peptidoglycan hydrolase-like protein with peptidoglycan-binding domain
MTWAIVSRAIVMAFLLGVPLDSTDGAPSSEIRGTALAAAAREAPRTAPEPRFVRDAQQALRDLGYEPGPIDGRVGPRTRTALLRYQHAEGLPATGRLDTETMVRLDIHQRVLQTSDAPEAVTGRRVASPNAP